MTQQVVEAEPDPAAQVADVATAQGTNVPPSSSAVGAYSQREFAFVEREKRGELTFSYIRNDGDPQHLEWCAAYAAVI